MTHNLRSYGQAEEMAQQLTALATLPGNPGSLPRVHMAAHTPLANTCHAKEAGKCSPTVSPQGAVSTQVGKLILTSAWNLENFGPVGKVERDQCLLRE